MSKKLLSPIGYDDLVQRIYDAVDVEEGFVRVLPDVGAFVGAVRAQSLVIGKGGEVLESRSFGADPARFEDYSRNWMDKDPRMAAAHARMGTILLDTKDIDREAFERSAILNEKLVFDDSVYSLFGNFPIEGDLLLAQAFLRGRKEGPFEQSHALQLRALLPHLKRATRLHHLMREMHELSLDLRFALDALPTPVAILEPTGKVVALNASAEALLSRDGSSFLKGGRLTASSPTEARELSAAIAKASVLANAGPVDASATLTVTPVRLERRDGEPLWALAYPLRPRNSFRDALRAGRVLVVFHDPETRVRLAPDLLANMYALTKTEAALASALAEGLSLADFAEARGCSEETARTHLKRVLEKTGTHRQADLVRVLLSTAALHSLR